MRINMRAPPGFTINSVGTEKPTHLMTIHTLMPRTFLITYVPQPPSCIMGILYHSPLLSLPLYFFSQLSLTQTFLLSSSTQLNPIHLCTLPHGLHIKVPRQIHKLVPHPFGANGGHMAASPLAQLSPRFHRLAFLRVDEGLKLRPVPIQGIEPSYDEAPCVHLKSGQLTVDEGLKLRPVPIQGIEPSSDEAPCVHLNRSASQGPERH